MSSSKNLSRGLKKTTLVFAAALLLISSVASADWEEGVAAFKAKNYTAAINAFRTVVEEQPDFAGGHLMLGQALLRAKKAGDAVPHLQKALELTPGDANTTLALGQAQYSSRKYRDAASTLSGLSIGSLPKSAQVAVYQMRGGSYSKLGDDARAVADLKRVADLKGDAASYYAWGASAFKANDISTAVTALGRASGASGATNEMKSLYVNALKRQGRTTRGDQKAAVYAKAESTARSLASSSPTYENLLLLGEVQLGAKKYDAALSSLKQAASKNSGDWLPLFYQGQALTSLERFTEAEGPLQSALAKTSKPDEQKQIWSQLGFTYEKQRKFSESIEAYQKGDDPRGVARVRENQQIDKENAEADQHNAQVKKLEEEQKRLAEELKKLPGGGR